MISMEKALSRKETISLPERLVRRITVTSEYRNGLAVTGYALSIHIIHNYSKTIIQAKTGCADQTYVCYCCPK